MSAVAPAAEAVIRRYELQLALEGWRGAPGTTTMRYEAAQGIVFALLRRTDPAAARAFHDANERKALAVSPVAIRALPSAIARATLWIGVWEQGLTTLLDTSLAEASEARLVLAGHPAVILRWRLCDALPPAQLLAAPAVATVRVRFESPTFFGFGRFQNGMSRAHLTPDPGLVVASWLRAWKLTGDRSLDWLPGSPEDLGARVALLGMHDVRTISVVERTARLTGFLGTSEYQWAGTEREGRAAIAALARFAEICGTGAKTGRGFGQTACVGAGPACDGTGE